MYDNRFFSGFGLRSAVYLSTLVVGIAFSGVSMADVATPPPSTPMQPTTTQTNITQAAHRTPVEQALIRRGLDPNNLHGATVSFPNQKPSTQQFGSVQNGVATKSNPVRITDPYGNVARTTVQTQTQLPSNNTLNKMAVGAIYGQIAGNIVNSPNAKQAARDIAHGNYGSAAVNAAAAFDAFNIGSGLYGLFDEYENAKAAIAQPMNDAATAKAQAAAAANQNQSMAEANEINQMKEQLTKGNFSNLPRLLIVHTGHLKGIYILPKDSTLGSGGYICGIVSGSFKLGNPNPHPDDSCLSAPVGIYETESPGSKAYKQYLNELSNRDIQMTIEDYLLTQSEIQAVIANAITNILNNQQENTAAVRDLVNMLWANNQLNEGNTQTTVIGTAAQNTFLSEPYTPAGSNQAQQTQHVINKDGSVTTSYIPRSDLKPNSNQAPTLKPKKDNDIDVDIDVGSDDKKEDDVEICNHENKDKVICLNAGSDDYENLDLPSETETLGFNKKDYFARNAACPAAVRINAFGMDMSISYEPWCDIARGIRPIIEFLGVLTAMGIAYGAVREL